MLFFYIIEYYILVIVYNFKISKYYTKRDLKKEPSMSSLCIKTNNEEILTYLQHEFSEFNMLNVFYS